MIEIPRYRMTNNFCHQDNNNGSWVRYADHVAAVQAARSQPKFKVGDRVTHRDGSIGVVKFVNLFEHATSFDVQWHTPMEISGTHPGKNLTLYVPPTPAKFKVGDRVVTKLTTKPWTITTADYVPKWKDWYYEGKGEEGYETDLDLYVPPTPAELIPTLKEHEWVRGVFNSGRSFGPYSTYLNGMGALVAGGILLRWSNYQIELDVVSIERCDAPEVK